MWYMNCFKSYVKCLTFFSLMKYLHSVLKVSAFCPYNGRPFKAIMGFAYAKNVTQCPNAHAHVSIFKGIIHAQNVSLKWNKTQYTIRNKQWTCIWIKMLWKVSFALLTLQFTYFDQWNIFRFIHSIKNIFKEKIDVPKIKLRHLKFPQHN